MRAAQYLGSSRPTLRHEASSNSLVELRLDDPRWMDLAAVAPAATVFHLPAWHHVISDTYGYRSALLVNLDHWGGVMAGVPAIRVRRLRGQVWVSLPFSDHCPLLARDDEGLRSLAVALVNWSRQQDVPLELRSTLPDTPGWHPTVVGTRHVLPLGAGLDALRQRVGRQHSRWLRHAERGDLRVRFGRSLHDVEAFYQLHIMTRRRLGIPVQPRRFFRSVWQHVIRPRLGLVVLVETPAQQPVAGAVLFTWNRTAIVKFQASDASSWRRRPNHLLYWAALRRAEEDGYQLFDFGRSDIDHRGLQDFKAGWGAEAIPLVYALTHPSTPAPGRRGPVEGAMRQIIRHSPAVVCRALGSVFYRYVA